MTENTDIHDAGTQNLETPPPPPPAAPEPPRSRWRDRRVGVVTLAVSTIAALVIGGTVGAATGGLVGYGVGHHDHPDRPGLARMQWPDQPRIQPPDGIPPALAPEESERSAG